MDVLRSSQARPQGTLGHLPLAAHPSGTPSRSSSQVCVLLVLLCGYLSPYLHPFQYPAGALDPYPTLALAYLDRFGFGPVPQDPDSLFEVRVRGKEATS